MKDMKNDSQLKALISMVDEPNDAIYADIVAEIMAYGKDIIPILEESWENTLEHHSQDRILQIIHKIQYNSIIEELAEWVKNGSSDLLSAYLLITRFQYPDIKANLILPQIERIRNDIWLEMNDQLTALEKVKVINHVIYDVYGFIGNKEDFHAPENAYLNTMLQTKNGNPLSLGMLYLILIAPLNLPIYGVNFPEHFVLCYTNEKEDEQLSFLEKNDILFYINAFSKGAVFSKKEATVFMKEHGIASNELFFKPCTNLDIIRRLINNLIYSYEKLGSQEKVTELNVLLETINHSE
ncbi:MAG TPA: transglutaminase-like domain-containing protein [Bacteroidales bacterium]|nr:transglutaminase-like domain-containing protein [Bacteroidales bacterium]